MRGVVRAYASEGERSNASPSPHARPLWLDGRLLDLIEICLSICRVGLIGRQWNRQKIMKPPFKKSSGHWLDASSEERRHARKSQNQLLLTAPVAGRIVDINETGIGIETREPLAVLAQSKFACSSDSTRLEFFGEIRWCRLTDTIPLPGGEGSPVYRAGIALVEP